MMESEQTILRANPQRILEPSKRKRARRDPGSVFDKNIVVLNSSDILENNDGTFLALNTMERAQLRRNKQRFKKVCFTQLMTEKDVRKKLEDPAVGIALLHKKRYKFASADGYGNLNFHGKEQWNGSEIKSWLPGTSALYILLQGIDQDERSKHWAETKMISTSRVADLCEGSAVQGLMLSSPPESPSLMSSCSISCSSSSSSSMTLKVQAEKMATSIKKEYNDGNNTCHHVTSFQTSKKTHTPQAILSWSSSPSCSLPKTSLTSVGVSGTWFPPVPKPFFPPRDNLRFTRTPREVRTSETHTAVSSDDQTLRGSHQCPRNSETRTLSTVVKQEMQVMSPDSGEVSSHAGSSEFRTVVPNTTDIKSDVFTCVQTQQNLLPSASSNVRSTFVNSGCKEPRGVSITAVTGDKYASTVKSLGTTLKQGEDCPERLFEEDSEKRSDDAISAVIQGETSSQLSSEESGLSRSPVQRRNELSTRLETACAETQEILSPGTQTCGETTSQVHPGNSMRNISWGESKVKSGNFNQIQIQEDVVTDLTNQAAEVFQEVFAQTLMASVGPLSKFLGGKRQSEEMMIQSVDQTGTVVKSSASVEQVDIVEEMWPKEGPCTGGGSFVILLKQDLPCVSAGQPVTVRFRPGDITCAYIHHQHKARLHGRSIPAAPCSGMALVTVVTEEGRVIGQTTFTYRDYRAEVKLQINRLLDETFCWSSEDPQNSSEDLQDSSDSYEDITRRLASVMDAVENAARSGDRPYFHKMLTSQRGKDSYKLCLNRGLDPESYARENGQTELATYLAARLPSISAKEDRQICEEVENESEHSGPLEQVSDPLGLLCEVASSRTPISQSTDTDHWNEGPARASDGNEAIKAE